MSYRSSRRRFRYKGAMVPTSQLESVKTSTDIKIGRKEALAVLLFLVGLGTFALGLALPVPLQDSTCVVGVVGAIVPIVVLYFAGNSDGRFVALNTGEAAVDRFLVSLKSPYSVICNFVPRDRVGDADRIVVGPHGVLLIEVKHFRRQVHIEGKNWRVRRRSGRWLRIKSPSVQALRCASALERQFQVPVRAIIAMPDGISIKGTPEVPVVRYSELVAYVRALPPRSSRSRVLDEMLGLSDECAPDSRVHCQGATF